MVAWKKHLSNREPWSGKVENKLISTREKKFLTHLNAVALECEESVNNLHCNEYSSVVIKKLQKKDVEVDTFDKKKVKIRL